MGAVPVAINGVFYPSNKKDPPIKGTMFGNAWIPGLHVGGGPVEPPPDIQPEPPLIIWGGPIDPHPDHGLPGPQPHPEHPIVIPPEPPPTEPPTQVEPPHEGWNWSPAMSGWYYLYVPGKDQPGPKRR